MRFQRQSNDLFSENGDKLMSSPRGIQYIAIFIFMCVMQELCTYGMQASMLGIFTFYSVSKDKSANLGNTWFQLLLLRVSANEYED